MKNGSFLVRFVDVVLILLFGFMSISQVQKKSRVAPPKSSETQKSLADDIVNVFISITNQGLFLVEGESKTLRTPEELRAYIAEAKAYYGEGRFKIRIRSNDTAPIQYAMGVAQICDDLGVPKALDVRLTGSTKND